MDVAIVGHYDDSDGDATTSFLSWDQAPQWRKKEEKKSAREAS